MKAARFRLGLPLPEFPRTRTYFGTQERHKMHRHPWMAAGLAVLATAWLLVGCGGGTTASPVTVVKTLQSISCSQDKPVAEEVSRLQSQQISWLRRYCKHDLTVGTVAACGVPHTFLSALDVTAEELPHALALGYVVYAPNPRDQDFDCE